MTSTVPGHRLDPEMLEGISVEFLDAESLDLTCPRIDWSQRRKAEPFNSLLQSTLLWAEKLQPQVRPTALMDQFPRIANLLAANWNDPIAFHSYMNNLLVDRRGGRHGFSSDIKNELIKLRTAYQLCNTDHDSAVVKSRTEGAGEPAS